ncbi:MAG: tetratricopeptide repeat protein [Alphaproteobacteria bacterium]
MSLRLLVFAILFFSLPSQAFAGFDEGKEAYDKGKWIQAIMNLRPAVEKGDARAMILLANMYMEGHGVGQDTKEAFTLYHGAAVQGNTDGMVAVATLYQTGNGTVANVPLAIGWFERAARLGNMDSALVYAIHMYQGSKGKDYDIKPDHEAAYRWFKIVAANSKNKKQARAAGFSADNLVKSLTNDEVIRGDREVANWKPELPENLGPDPEQKFLKDFNEKEKKEQEQKVEEKKEPAPAPAPVPEEKKPEEKKPAPKTQPKK